MDACLHTVVRISREINLLLQSAESRPGEVSFAAPFHTTLSYSFVGIAGRVLIHSARPNLDTKLILLGIDTSESAF